MWKKQKYIKSEKKTRLVGLKTNREAMGGSRGLEGPLKRKSAAF